MAFESQLQGYGLVQFVNMSFKYIKSSKIDRYPKLIEQCYPNLWTGAIIWDTRHTSESFIVSRSNLLSMMISIKRDSHRDIKIFCTVRNPFSHYFMRVINNGSKQKK